jgi:DNA (cytosine-5)-methyltransferase 1
MMRRAEMTYTFYEFFAGAGLVSLGLEPDWSSVWANDISDKKARVYLANRKTPLFVLGDVAGVDPASLPPGADMAWASFPCQDLSLAGWGRGISAARSGSFWAFWRVMRGLIARDDRPPLIVLENVPGLLYGEDFRGLAEALAALGMQFGALQIDARLFVPQSRPRLFVIAMDSRVDCRTLVDPGVVAVPWFPGAVRNAYLGLPSTLKHLWRWWSLPVPNRPPRALTK